MKTATLTETKNQLSSLIDQVRHGETILILDRGRPVARLASVIAEDGDASEGRIARLERKGILRRAPVAKTPEILDFEPIRTKSGVSAVELLIDERRNGR